MTDLLLFGGGHVGRALAEKAVGLDFETTVCDDRPEFLDPGEFPPRTRLLLTEPNYAGILPLPGPRSFVCVLTRCHRTDLAVLRNVVRIPAPYIGLIGSRRKAKTLSSRLISEGIPESSVRNIRSPIGLPIGGNHPSEVAISILAGMIQVRSGVPLRPRDGAPRRQKWRKSPSP